MSVIAEQRHALSDGDVRRLHGELERLMAENAALRAQVARASATRRRWAGRLSRAVILALGFPLGLWCTEILTRDLVRGVRAGWDQAHQANRERDGRARAPQGQARAGAAVPRQRP